MQMVPRDPRVSFPKSLSKIAISILFRGLLLRLPDEDSQIGTAFYGDLINNDENPRMSLIMRQKFILFAHYRFFLSKFFGNYHTSAIALTHHAPTMQTIFVLQHVSINFFRPVEPNYPFESGHPPISMNKCCQILAILDSILKRNPQFGNIELIEMLRLVQSCAFANIGIKIDSDAAFGFDSSYLRSITFWREITAQMIWSLANRDGLLMRMIPKFIFNKNRSTASKLAT
jgi:hypothetical protein